MDKKICVIGGGRWGKNHIRTLAGLGCLAAVVEADAARLKEYTGAVSRNKGICGHGRSHCLRLRRIYGCASCGTSLSGRQELLEKGLNVMLESR